MISVKKHGVILSARSSGFDSQAVLNPAVIEYEDNIHLFYRGVDANFRSGIGHCLLIDPLHVLHRLETPVLKSEFEYESQGVEDPRIVHVDNQFYLSYTAYDGYLALGAVATSTDLKQFKKQGIIAPKIPYAEFRRVVSKKNVSAKYFRFDQCSKILWDKNLIFFPRRISGKLAFLHRIRPGIQIAYAKDLTELNTDYWDDYLRDFATHIVLDPKFEHEVSYIGGGCPPVETESGWLLIYHSVHDTLSGFIYSACAALLDLEDPTKVISRLPYPLFKPEEDYEKNGDVNNVCFPTGTILRDNKLYMYYGAADKQIACASVNIDELINELLKHAK
ncbi:MAG: pesticidal protein Cry7Aa [Flavobacterium sp.]|nr:pesticidal protein Cry7Aa [Flavobacterium sp.]